MKSLVRSDLSYRGLQNINKLYEYVHAKENQERLFLIFNTDFQQAFFPRNCENF